jgi:hypothetical protein
MVQGTKRLAVRRWLAAARHRRDGAIAVGLLVLPWVIALVLVPDHHLDATAVTILAAVSIPMATLWLTWVAVRDAKRSGTPDGGLTAGQVVYQESAVAGIPVSLAPRPTLLAGREDLLTALDTRLSAGDAPWPRMAVLCGLGGAGKTSLAVEYAHRHRHLGDIELAWQVPAEDPAVLAAGFGDLAAQLGARDLLDRRDPVASVHAMLAKQEAGWLLIFDNAPDQGSVETFLPPAGRGQVLITSQNPNWPPSQALDVPVLGTEVAAEFLVNRTSDPDLHAAAELAGELGGLPLALEQAGAYIQATGNSLAGYLALFRQQRPAMLGRGEPTGYRGTVATTWAVAFARLDDLCQGVGLREGTRVSMIIV